MKKVFSFFAMIALVGMMVACGGDKPNKEGVTSKNEIKEGDSDALKMVKITDQLLNIMDQEPSAEGYEMMMNTTMKMMNLDVQNVSEEEIKKVATEAGFDFVAMPLSLLLTFIAMKALGAMMASMPEDEPIEDDAEPIEMADEEGVEE